MIIAHDDYPYHQTSSSFDEAATSDVRFFDRYWFSVVGRNGEFGLIAGVGVYRNMDVLDGFFSLSHGTQQTNVRVSRTLRPDWTTFGAGPFRFEIIEPMRRHRVVLDDNDQGMRCDLLFEATTEPFGERRYHQRERGWLEKDYVRMFQLARATGWIEVDGHRFESGEDGWAAGRDRSFGSRPGVGGPNPARGGTDLGSGLGAREALLIGTLFETEEHYGTWTLGEDGEGAGMYSTGTIYDRSGRAVTITGSTHDLHFAPKSRVIQSGRIVLGDDTGREWVLELTAGPTFVYQGFGYIDGWHDRRGLGVSRGAAAVEGERYDLSDPGDIVDRSGTHELGRHGLMHTLMQITLDGRPGSGEGIFFLLPEHPRYGGGGA